VIYVTKLDGRPAVLNAELIECIECIPETVVCLTNGRRVIVRETVEELVNAAIEYRRRTLLPLAGRIRVSRRPED